MESEVSEDMSPECGGCVFSMICMSLRVPAAPPSENVTHFRVVIGRICVHCNQNVRSQLVTTSQPLSPGYENAVHYADAAEPIWLTPGEWASVPKRCRPTLAENRVILCPDCRKGRF